MKNELKNEFRLETEQLYWKVNSEDFPFNTTKDIKPSIQIFGHDTAIEALTFAIECHAPGQNAYVRGLTGSGRKTLVKQLFKDLQPKARLQRDYCYVHNFLRPNKPRLIILNSGYGKLLKQMLSSFAIYVGKELPKNLNNEQIRENRQKVENETNKSVGKIYKPLEDELAKNSLTLANIKENNQTKMIIAPLIDGNIASPEQINQLLQEKKITTEYIQSLNEKVTSYQEQLIQVSNQANEIIENSYTTIYEMDNDFAKKLLSEYLNAISKKFTNKFLDEYLDEIKNDFIENQLHSQNEKFDPSALYGVNILNEKRKNDKAPVIFENTPNLTNLLGAVETENNLPYASISAGSLLNADGGYLILEVDKALSDSSIWATIMHVAKTGELSISFEDNSQGKPAVVSPEAIPLDVKIILIGSHQRYYDLNHYDANFGDYFKVLVDLESDLLRNEDSYMQYAQITRKIVDQENLLHFSKHAIGQLIEHGARIGHGKDKISARFGRVMDLAREASYLANKDVTNINKIVAKKHIVNAIKASKRRASLPVKRFYKVLKQGTIIVDTSGAVTGQINGLAVSKAGNISYGFPARITATIAPGQAGLINIEGQADLSGQIHTKGFQILGGLLRFILKPKHPLSFSASIAFEQSYGGIDGDSASGAEACCLLSAITGIPINQSLSMTGAIDQFGHLQAIGGVNEKVEGFFDVCKNNGLTGEQGVIIPKSNAAELMLKPAIVDAFERGDFHIYAVDHVLDAVSILTNTDSCKLDLLANKPYKKGSLLAIACEQSELLYQQSKSITD